MPSFAEMNRLHNKWRRDNIDDPIDEAVGLDLQGTSAGHFAQNETFGFPEDNRAKVSSGRTSMLTPPPSQTQTSSSSLDPQATIPSWAAGRTALYGPGNRPVSNAGRRAMADAIVQNMASKDEDIPIGQVLIPEPGASPGMTPPPQTASGVSPNPPMIGNPFIAAAQRAGLSDYSPQMQSAQARALRSRNNG